MRRLTQDQPDKIAEAIVDVFQSVSLDATALSEEQWVRLRDSLKSGEEQNFPLLHRRNPRIKSISTLDGDELNGFLLNVYAPDGQPDAELALMLKNRIALLTNNQVCA